MRWKLLLVLSVTLAILSTASAQSTYYWNGNASGSTWTSVSNWNEVALRGNTATRFPGVDAGASITDGTTTDIAYIGNPITSIGINANTTGGLLSLGAIMQNTSTDLALVNSTSNTSLILQLNGAYAGNPFGLSANTLIRVGTANLTLANTSETQKLGVRLGIASGVFDVATGRTLTITSNITESTAGSGFTVQGGGTVALGGTNSYTGSVNVANGWLRFDSAAAIGGTGGVDITVGSTGGIAFNYAGLDAASFASLLTNRVAPTSGTIALTTHQAGFDVNFSSTGINFPNAYLGAIGNVTAGTFTPANDGIYRLGGGGGTLTLNQNITSGSVLVGGVGGGTVVLGGTNSYTGTTTVQSGTLLYSTAGAVSSGAVGRNITVNANGAVGFAFADAATLPTLLANRVDTASTGTIALTSTQAAASVNFATAGLTEMFLGATGTVTYTGTYTPGTSTLRLGGGGGTLNYGANIASGTSVIIGGGGGGNVNLTGTNNFSALTIKPGGTLSAPTRASLGSGTITLEGGTLNTTIATPNNNTTGSYLSAIVLAGDAAIVPSSTVTMNSAWFQGGLTVSGDRTLYLGSAGAIVFATTPITLNGNITVVGTGGFATTAGITFSGADRTITMFNSYTIAAGDNNFRGTYNFPGQTLTLAGTAGVIIGTSGGIADGNTGGIIINGPSVRFERQNTFTGGVRLVNGVLVFGESTNGGTGAVTASPVGTGPLRLSGGYVRTNTTADTRTIRNVLQVDGHVTFAADFAPIIFSSTSQTFSNNPIITNLATSISFTPTSSSITLSSDVTFDGSGNTILGDLNFGSAARTLTKGGTGTLTLSGAAANAVAGTQFLISQGTVTLGNAAAPGAGVTTVTLGSATGNTSGVLNLNALSPTLAGLTTAGTGTSSQVVNSGASPSTLTVSYSGGTPQTFAGRLGGGATGNDFGFTKAGAGTFILAGTNTYTGDTLVSLGTLVLNGSVSTGLLTVSVGGTLSGTGTVGGPLTVQGILAPGDSTGTLTVNDDVILNGTYQFQPGTGLTIGTGGSLTLGASSVLIATGLTAESYTIATFPSGSRTGTFDTLTITDGYSIIYNSTSIVLTSVPEPSSLLVVGVIATALLGRLRLRRRKLAM